MTLHTHTTPTEGLSFFTINLFYFAVSMVLCTFADMKRRMVFIMNPISGTANKAGIPEIIANTLDTSIFDYEIRLTEHAGHAFELATEAKEAGIDIVVAIGGDGTVN